MTPLGRVLIERIRRDGPLPIADYMTLCLSDPEHGYYRRADAIGSAGDFITAPEISQMFGEMLGLWAAEVWNGMGRPAAIRLVELGPGRGTLMADALRAIGQTVPAFAAAIDLHLVEINRQLRARQAAALAAARPSWHESIETIPPGPAIILANEFFDALPIRQFERTAEGWRERCVGIDAMGERLVFVTGASIATPPLEPAHAAAAIGDIAEISPACRALAAALAARIAAQGGAVLIIDYGPLASGVGDSLQAVQRHRKIGPLDAPGESDLTAHVDFSALGRAAHAAGGAVYGPLPQGVFLHRIGIVARAATLLRNASPEQARHIVAACERLIGEAGMGTLFKALAITAPEAPTPPGFDPLPPR